MLELRAGHPGGFRFCGACGSPLADAPGQAAGEASEREWLKVRLAPLVGMATAGEAPAGRDESFMAWRRFLQLVARQSP